MAKHWKYKAFTKHAAIVWSPTVHEYKVTGLGMCREIYKELRSLEILLKELDFKFWVIYTELKNTHMMILLSKLGCDPYKIDERAKTLWYRKEL